MSEVLSLTAEIREELGTGAVRELLRKGMVPAAIYRAGKKPLSVAIEEKEITLLCRKLQYLSQIIQFEIGEKKQKVLQKSLSAVMARSSKNDVATQSFTTKPHGFVVLFFLDDFTQSLRFAQPTGL